MIKDYDDYFDYDARETPKGCLYVSDTLPVGGCRILITGGQGNLAKQLTKYADEYGWEVCAPNREEVDITCSNKYDENFDDVITNVEPDYVIHAAARTKPMSAHEEDPFPSIKANIIGTCNVVEACMTHNVKLIYISTDYVYPGTDGNYHEDDPVKPFNNYGWSKLGGECAVQMYKNSLIVRLSITKRPFSYPKALTDVHKSLMYTDDAAKAILSVLDEKGVINVGGPRKTVYDFAKESGADIGRISIKDIKDAPLAVDTSMNIERLNGAR